MKKLYLAGCILGCLGFISPAFGNGLRFEAELSGAQEVPVPGVSTDASGMIKVRFDEELTEVKVQVRVRDSAGMFNRAHFHCALPGENGTIAFGLVDPGPLTFNRGRIDGTLTNADFNGNDCVPAIGRPVNNIAALALAMRDGLIYFNVHSTAFPGGELRGQMLP